MSMERAHKLILGCGYLGSRVAGRWLANGDRVSAVTRSPNRADAFRRLGITPVIADVLDPTSLAGLPAADTILYAIGFDRGSGKTMREVYVDGLRNVLSAWTPQRPQRFLYVGSTSVYGQTSGEWVDEASPTIPAGENGRILLAAESLLQTWAHGHPVMLRFAGIYGPDRLIRGEALTRGEPLGGDPDHWLNLIHVEDGVSAVLAAERSGRPGAVYNVCDNEPVRRRDFYEQLAVHLGLPKPRFEANPAQPGGRDTAHRRIANRKLRQELGVALSYPSFRDGLTALAGGHPA